MSSETYPILPDPLSMDTETDPSHPSYPSYPSTAAASPTAESFLWLQNLFHNLGYPFYSSCLHICRDPRLLYWLMLFLQDPEAPHDPSDPSDPSDPTMSCTTCGTPLTARYYCRCDERQLIRHTTRLAHQTPALFLKLVNGFLATRGSLAETADPSFHFAGGLTSEASLPLAGRARLLRFIMAAGSGDAATVAQLPELLLDCSHQRTLGDSSPLLIQEMDRLKRGIGCFLELMPVVKETVVAAMLRHSDFSRLFTEFFQKRVYGFSALRRQIRAQLAVSTAEGAADAEATPLVRRIVLLYVRAVAAAARNPRTERRNSTGMRKHDVLLAGRSVASNVASVASVAPSVAQQNEFMDLNSRNGSPSVARRTYVARKVARWRRVVKPRKAALLPAVPRLLPPLSPLLSPGSPTGAEEARRMEMDELTREIQQLELEWRAAAGK